MKKILTLFTLFGSFLCGQSDQWTVANDSSYTMEVSIWETNAGTYSSGALVQPGRTVTLYSNPEANPYLVYLDNHSLNRSESWFGAPDTGLGNRPGNHRKITILDAPGDEITVREFYPTGTDEANASENYLAIFLAGMGIAATVRLVRVGLRWTRALGEHSEGA